MGIKAINTEPMRMKFCLAAHKKCKNILTSKAKQIKFMLEHDHLKTGR